MVELDKDTYRKLVARSGLPFQFVVKEHKLLEVLKQLLPALADPAIILKGGTALNKIYFREQQRFSEDIDFDYVGPESDKEKIEKLKRWMAGIPGFPVDGPWKYHSTIRFHCVYQYQGKKDHVRVEFGLKGSSPTLEPVAIGEILSAMYNTSIAGVRCYGFDDLVARKMLALHDRAAGRDIWDCHHAISKTKNLKKALSIVLEEEEKIPVKQFLEETIERIRKADIGERIKLTNPYISRHRRPNWKELVNTLIMQLERMI